MQKVNLQVGQRNETGKGPARRLRAQGKIPAILYGHKKEPLKLILDAHSFYKMMEQLHSNPIFDLQIASDSGTINKIALLKERQLKPIDGTLVHLDFLEVSMDEYIDVDVPIHFEGSPVGVEKGGSFQIVMRELKVTALPDSIPESIVVDISELDLGSSIHIGDIQLPDGVKAVQDATGAVATILTQRKADEQEAAAPEAEA